MRKESVKEETFVCVYVNNTAVDMEVTETCKSTISSVLLLSGVCLFVTPCSSPGFPVHHHLPESSQAHVHHFEMPSNHLTLCFPLYFLPSTFPSKSVFSNESVLRMRFPKYWSFSFSISPSNAYSWLISFRIDCLDSLAVQGTFKSLLQYHSSKASILWCTAFFAVQLTSIYGYWKNHWFD